MNHLRVYNSAARLDAVGFGVPIERAALRTLLEPFALTLAPENGASAEPVIWFELWRVQGAVVLGGLEQDQWFERAGRAASALAAGSIAAGRAALRGAAEGGRAGARYGPLGAVWGAYAGFWGSAALAGLAGLGGFHSRPALGAGRQSLASLRDGAETPAADGGMDGYGSKLGRAISSSLSRAFGTYHELLIGVPGVRRAGAGAPHLLVLGMRSDGAVSLWGDRWLGTGYRKRAARILHSGAGEFDVWDSSAAWSGKPGLRARFHFESAPNRRDENSPELSGPRAVWQQPLLGVIERGAGPARLVVTHLERDLSAPDVRWSALRGTLQLDAGLAPELAAGRFELTPLSAATPFGAFQVSGLPVRLTYPEALPEIESRAAH